jgi:hypothetical protein
MRDECCDSLSHAGSSIDPANVNPLAVLNAPFFCRNTFVDGSFKLQGSRGAFFPKGNLARVVVLHPVDEKKEGLNTHSKANAAADLSSVLLRDK